MRRLVRFTKPLRRLIYQAVVIAYQAVVIAWVTLVWQARSDVTEMVIFGVVVVFLIGMRGYWSGWHSLVPLRKG